MKPGAKQAALTAREAARELLRILRRRVERGICQPSAVAVKATARLQPRALAAQTVRSDLWGRRSYVQREVELAGGAQQRLEPAARDLPRITNHRQRPVPQLTGTQTVALKLHRARRQQRTLLASGSSMYMREGAAQHRITPCSREPAGAPGGSSTRVEQRGRLLAVERAQLDAGVTQKAGRLTRAPLQHATRRLSVASARGESKQDLAATKALTFGREARQEPRVGAGALAQRWVGQLPRRPFDRARMRGEVDGL